MPAKSKCSNKTSEGPRRTQRLSSSSEISGPTEARESNSATQKQEYKKRLSGRMIGRDKR